MKKFVILLVLTAMLGFSCQKPETSEKPAPSTSSEDRVVARVEGQTIMLSELDKRVDNFEAKFREINPQMKLPEEKRIQMRKDFLDREIKDKIFEVAAAKHDYTVAEEEIDSRIEQLQKIFGEGEEAKQKFLSGINDMKEFRDNIAKQIKIDKFVEAQLKDKIPEVTENAIDEYYQSQPDMFREEESVKARHILWRLPARESPDYQTSHTEMLKLAESVVKEIKSGGDFAQLARTHSQDPKSAESGGDLGWIRRKQMVKEFEDVAFSLAPGEVSNPLETSFGIHIVQVLEKKEARSKPLDEVRSDIRAMIERKQKGEAREKLFQDIKANTKIEIME